MSHSPEPTHQIQKLDPPSDARQPTTTTGPQNTYPMTGPDPNIAHPSKRDTTVSPLCHARTRFRSGCSQSHYPNPLQWPQACMHACMYVRTYPTLATVRARQVIPRPDSHLALAAAPCPIVYPARPNPIPPRSIRSIRCSAVQCGAVRCGPSPPYITNWWTPPTSC